jgi:hypothetical protein
MKNVRLALEFAPQPQGHSRVALGLVGAALLLCLLAALQAGATLADNARQVRLLAAAASAASPASAPARPARAAPGETAGLQWIRQTSRTLATPWADLLQSMEAAPSNVALLQLEPSAPNHSLTLVAEAAGAADMLNYLHALQTDQRLSNVVLVSHQVQLQAPGTPVRFKLRANWGEAP